MEKYLVIILLVLLLWSLYQCFVGTTVITEGFADTIPTNVDTNNSIDTLAQIAKALQAGGLTIPGPLNIGGGMTLSPGTVSPDAANITFGDGTGWGINFNNSKSKGVARLDDKGNLNITGGFNLLPRGVIVAYYGNAAPAGWVLCDGNQGTPDLRGRFILGGSTSGTMGGAQTVTLRRDQIPPHQHTSVTSIPWGNGILGNGDTSFSAGGAAKFGVGGNAFYTGNGTEGGLGNNPISIMPPYYTLCYIMKT